jgi:SAM-dependent methyltransferase
MSTRNIDAVRFSVPLRFRRGSLREDERASVESGRALLSLIARFAPLEQAKILDFGCGVKLVQALLQDDCPIRKYLGVDVHGEMIEFLRANVRDKRFEFGTLNFHNRMYNKSGEAMTTGSLLAISPDTFGILTMFSVVTHLEPGDTLAALGILRRYAAEGAKLIFSAFIDPGQKEEFIDTIPDRPLLNAVYRRDFLEDLIGKAGWQIESFNRPIASVIQHHYVCSTR